jgi:hypothetical protein
MKSNLLPLIMILASFVIPGCTDTITQPDLEGSLVGYVYTFDEFANLLDDHSEVQVTAVGSDHFSTRTDKNGRFEFKNLPAGTYELNFEKPGFGTLKQFGIQHLGGQPTTLGLNFNGSTNSSAFFIYQMPTTEILSLSVENDTLTGVFSFRGNTEPQYVTLRIFYSNLEDFEITNAQLVTDLFLLFRNGAYTGEIYNLNTIFNPGEKVFFKACVLFRKGAITDFVHRIIIGIDSYFDFPGNATIYPNQGNESAQFSFIFQE